MSRKSYPNVNAANQYARDVVRGKIVACQFVIQACQRHLDDLMEEKSKSFRYRFDKDLAERAAKFIQLLPHTKGEWAFKRMPITLEPWQLFVICCAFGWVNKGSRLRRFREVYTEIPRKNGKSAISAGVALYCFACDNEFGAEVYSGATTEKQAWEVFRPARLMCKRTPMLTEAFGIEVNASNMNRPEDGARFEPLIGNYLWRPGLELGQPSSLAGYGIAENEQMPDIAADAKAIAFGNFKRGYTIVDRIGTRILRDPYTNKPFVGFYTTKRTGGMLVDSQAIKLLKIAVA